MTIMRTSEHVQLDDTRVIDRDSPLPYYYQLKEFLVEQIESGNWKSGQQLPSEPEFCQRLGVSRTVVRHALQELVYEGLLYRQQGKGTFVAEPKISESLVQSLSGFYEDMEDRGLTPVSQVLEQSLTPANKKVAEYLEVPVGTPVIKIERLRSVNGEPIVLVTTYLPYETCPALMEEDLSRQSLYALLEGKYGLEIARGRRTLEVVPASEYEARLLGVEENAPLVLLNSVSYLKDGRPIEYFHALHRGDRSKFEVELVRVRKHGSVSVRELTALPRSNTLRE